MTWTQVPEVSFVETVACVVFLFAWCAGVAWLVVSAVRFAVRFVARRLR